MPHLVAKLLSGYTRQQKVRLTHALSKAIVETLDCPYFDVSVGIEDVLPADWAERVHRLEITDKPDTIYRPPGSAPRAATLPVTRRTHA